MMDADRSRRLMKIAYFHLFEKKALADVRAILAERGATEVEIDAAIHSAKQHLRELSAYRNRQLLMTLALGVALTGVGVFLIPAASTAAPRFQAMPFGIAFLGLATVVYAFWSRLQPH